MVLFEDLTFKPKDVPPPPPLPKYDVNQEASKWSWSRIYTPGGPVDKSEKPWTPIGTQPASADDPDWRGVIKNKVIELPMPGQYPYGKYTPSTYFWFDTPDYADPFKKLWYCTKHFFAWGGLAAVTMSILVKPGPVSQVEHLRRKFVSVGWPIFSGGLIAGTTVITLANLRGKKDDYYNYAPAGLLAGMLVARHNYQLSFLCGVLGSAYAVICKYNAEINGTLYPIFNYRQKLTGYSGLSSKGGITTGDFRLGFRGDHGDPGRDVRTVS